MYTVDETVDCEELPQGLLRGRTIENSLRIHDSKGITIANMTFWASNILAYEHVSNITLDSLDFKFPSSSQRMLKSAELPIHTRMSGDHNIVINSTFEGPFEVIFRKYSLNKTYMPRGYMICILF